MRLFSKAEHAFVMLCFCFCGLTAQPKLQIVGGTTRDIGDIYTGSARFAITLLNTGTDSLKISDVSTSCGCTAAMMSTQRIAPGDSGKLDIKFNGTNYQGRVEKLISMTTNDTSKKYVTLKFSANVVRNLTFEPDHLYFSTVQDSAKTDTFEISNSSEGTIHIQSMKSPSPNLKIHFKEGKVGPGESVPITATFQTGQTGTSSGDVEITTDYKPYPVFHFRYFALVKEKRFSTKIPNH